VMLTVLLGCSGGSTNMPLREEIAWGDRQRDWALVYYQSWRRELKPHYLKQARNQMMLAIQTYYRLQVRMGHSYPDFYRVDNRRRNGCEFLNEISRMGLRYRVEFSDTSRDGCMAGG